MGRARALALTAAALLVIGGGCLFPSLDGLSDGGADVTTDTTSGGEAGGEGGEGGGDADADAEAGMCPPNSDPSLVAYYPLDEGTGVVAHDCSGHGFDALLTGSDAGSAWTAGHLGAAVQFVSANQICVIVSSASANQSGGPVTATAWVNMAPFTGGGYIVGQRAQVGYAWRVDIESDDAGSHLGFAVGTGDDAGNDYLVDTLLPAGSWHHVAGVFDQAGASQAIYLDGVPTSVSSGQTIVLDPIASTIRIGCRADDSNYFDGIIDEVRVYSRALSPTEISALSKL